MEPQEVFYRQGDGYVHVDGQPARFDLASCSSVLFCRSTFDEQGIYLFTSPNTGGAGPWSPADAGDDLPPSPPVLGVLDAFEAIQCPSNPSDMAGFLSGAPPDALAPHTVPRAAPEVVPAEVPDGYDSDATRGANTDTEALSDEEDLQARRRTEKQQASGRERLLERRLARMERRLGRLEARP